jgi:hypothetical protein
MNEYLTDGTSAIITVVQIGGGGFDQRHRSERRYPIHRGHGVPNLTYILHLQQLECPGSVPQLAQLHAQPEARPADDEHVIQCRRVRSSAGLCDVSVQIVCPATVAFVMGTVCFPTAPVTSMSGSSDLPQLASVLYLQVL